LAVVALPAPGMPVLGAVVDEEKHARGRHALDKGVQEGLSLSVDPVSILEEDQKGLDLAFANQQALDRIEGLLSPLGWTESIPRGVVGGDRKEPQHRGEIGLQGTIEKQDFPSDLLTNPAGVVSRLDLKVDPEQLDDWPEARGFAVGRRGRFERDPSLHLE